MEVKAKEKVKEKLVITLDKKDIKLLEEAIEDINISIKAERSFIHWNPPITNPFIPGDITISAGESSYKLVDFLTELMIEFDKLKRKKKKN